MKLNNDQLQLWQRVVVVLGLLILIIASIFFVGCLGGVLAFDQFSIGGQSGLRTIAGIAISGCLLAAIGFWDN
tara:strand:- start:7947 stop:8165 length:219 start_codon:yes stop_codon:yes gene_type:complete